MNFDHSKHNASFEVSLIYLRTLLTIFQCSPPKFAMNRFITLTVCAMFGFIQIIANIELPTTNVYGVRDSFIIFTLLLRHVIEDNL